MIFELTYQLQNCPVLACIRLDCFVENSLAKFSFKCFHIERPCSAYHALIGKPPRSEYRKWIDKSQLLFFQPFHISGKPPPLSPKRDKNKSRNRALLWNYRLGHIYRGNWLGRSAHQLRSPTSNSAHRAWQRQSKTSGTRNCSSTARRMEEEEEEDNEDSFESGDTRYIYLCRNI